MLKEKHLQGRGQQHFYLSMTSKKPHIVARETLISTSSFTKHFDKLSGRYYHVAKATGDSTWDVPYGQKVPLETVSPKIMNTLSKDQHSKADNSCTLYSTDSERQDRLRLIKSRRDTHIRFLLKESSLLNTNKDHIMDAIWKNACDDCGKDGIVRVNWQELGYISERIYTFENDYDTPLRNLSMLGNHLQSLYNLPEKCQHLQRLYLASNQIREIDSSIGSMIALTHLNLVRNRLHTLPSSIGNLVNMQVLDLANNCLKKLPNTIGKLNKIIKMNLDCNMLESLPGEVTEMNCEELSINDNKLISLPMFIGRMSSLQVLLANDNCLKSLPANICSSPKLRTVHLSKNYIMELPKSIGNIVSLECLWLDFNKLASLPFGFHRLKNLKEDGLKLEGNPMMSPPIDTIVKGTTEILEWCESELVSCELAKNRRIVVCVQSFLEQVGKYKLCGINQNEQPHESVYEAGVDYKGEKFYQFLFPTFWSNFIPSMEVIWANIDESHLKKGVMYSLPYERLEIEQALNQFHDAGGKVMHYIRQAKFRCCCCVDKKTGKRKVCIPLKQRWMCERPAVLVRMDTILESEMVEKRRRVNETSRIEKATNVAVKMSKRYLLTNEGEAMICSMAKKWLDSGLSSNNNDLPKYPQTSKEWRTVDLREYEKRNTSIISMVKKCIRGHQANKLEEAESIIREKFIASEIEAERSQAIKINKLLKKTIDKWKGNRTRAIYFGWKGVVNNIKLQRKTDEEKKRETDKLRHDGKLLMHEIVTRQATLELDLWNKCWDDFDDIPYWINSQTGETQIFEPKIEDILPSIKLHSKRTVGESSIAQISTKKAQFEGEVRHSGKSSGSEIEALSAASRVLERRRILLQNNIEDTSAGAKTATE